MDSQFLKKELEREGEVVTKRLEKWADEIPDNVFFYYGEDDKKYSFNEFNKIVNSIGHSLMQMGIEKGDRISTFMKNPLINTFLMFGIWKIGAVYCPINFNYRGRLLAYQIKDTNPKAIVTEIGMVSLINEIKDEIEKNNVIVYYPNSSDHDYFQGQSDISLDNKFIHFDYQDLLRGGINNLDVELNYRDIANIIYTSGTTGPAKGVVQSYRWINNYLFNWRRLFKHDDVIYNDLPLYHVGAAFFNIARAAWVGCQNAVWDRFNNKEFWGRINKCGATSCILLDVMIPWLMNAEEKPDDYKNTLNKVYMQPLPQYHHQVAKRFGFDFVISGFGQTEAGHGAICVINELERGTPKELFKGYSKEEILNITKKYKIAVVDGQSELKKGFMGKSSSIFEANIFDPNDNECAVGEVGELVFRTKFPYLFINEYFSKPEATLKAFRNLWFHTGDACYKDAEDNLYFVDRMGGVIRVKGELVSSYQVEDIINRYQKVNVSAAFPIPAEVGDEDDIVVYIVPKVGEDITEDEIRSWAKKEMPKFMQPKYIRFIDDLPRTPTSKIEKYKLREIIKKEIG